jgi:hypothetical protein
VYRHFRRARWEDSAQYFGGWWNRRPLKQQLVSKRKRLILQWENQNGYEKNLESTHRQVFQQAGVPGHKGDSVGPPGHRPSGNYDRSFGKFRVAGKPSRIDAKHGD